MILVASDFKQEGRFLQVQEETEAHLYTSVNGYAQEEQEQDQEALDCFRRHFNGLVGDAHMLCKWLLPHLHNTKSRVLYAISLNTLMNSNSK